MGTSTSNYQSIPENLLTHPLKDFQVLTGHNAFLKNVQNLSVASASNIKKAMQLGARYILIDVYYVLGKLVVAHGDGDSIITTYPANLNDCLQVISDYAFTVTSDPLLLNIEVYVPVERRPDLSQAIKDVFGSKLLLPTELSQSPWLTPIGQLRNKIVILETSKLDIDASTGFPDNSYHANSDTINALLAEGPLNTQDKWFNVYQADSFWSGLGLNMDPTTYLNVGIQAIAMNVLVNDDNLKPYLNWFNSHGFVLQPGRTV